LSLTNAVELGSDVVLRDGSTVHVRPARRGDVPAVAAFLSRLSPGARALRFFENLKPEGVERETNRELALSPGDGLSLVATLGGDENVIAHALFARLPGSHGEFALAVADSYQGRGLGTILLGQLTESAAAAGVRTLEAEVKAENHRMVQLLQDCGFPVEVVANAGQLHVTFPTALAEEAKRHFDDREQIAAANALKAFLEPRSVAVVGASRDPRTIGGAVFRNLILGSFAGPVYPVNPAASVVQSVPAYPSVEAIPGPVDLAVVAVRSDLVGEVAEQCARKGVRAIVVISAGFAEVSGEGRARQDRLLQTCRRAGIRLIGPNCMGILNTDPEVRLEATFAPNPPPEGRVAFSSQSGALGLAIIEHARGRGLGLSSFVSVGNKADVSGNDLISYWDQDERTAVILLYLESFGNPRRFARIARRVGQRKPIVVVKSGRSKAGARATSSHTGALLASSDVTVDALFRQAGVIRTDSLEELFDVAALLSTQPAPVGRRVGIVTNAGGPAILCADACEAEGLQVPVLAPETQQRLQAFLPASASVGNPVDMIASASGEQFRRSLLAVAADPEVDAIIAIFIPPLATRSREVAESIAAAARELKGRKTVLSVFMAEAEAASCLAAPDVSVPIFAFPEAAAKALARVARYGEWRGGSPRKTAVEVPGVRRAEAASIVARALERGPGWLDAHEVRQLLDCYGLPAPPDRIVRSPEEAGSAASDLAGEVALKILLPGLVHKTEAGGVRLHLSGRDAVKAAAAEMLEAADPNRRREARFLVQRMAEPGIEMIVGVVHDPQFGPVLACGAGGALVELLGDVQVCLTPLNEGEARELVRSLRSYPLLRGYRGARLANEDSLVDVVVRVAAMAEDLPGIAELDCNPVIVSPAGSQVVDARVRVEAHHPRPPLGSKA
jgi:acetyl coenzyme A synthetase (ADP forming)-like protein